MDNEVFDQSPTEGEAEEIAPSKKKSRKGLITFVILMALAGWFLSGQSTSAKISKSERYNSIIKRSSEEFFNAFKPGEVFSNYVLYLDESITQNESVLIKKNLDLAMQYLHEPLSSKTFDIRIFDDYKSLKSDMLQNSSDWMVDYLLQDLSEKGVFGENRKCDAKSSVGSMYEDGWIRPRIYILAECAWYEQDDGSYILADPDVIAHEIVHIAQLDWFNSSNFVYTCFVPKWFSEGEAQFVSAQIATMDNEFDYEYFRNLWLGWDPDGKLAPDEKYGSNFGPYSDGAFGIEYLVGTYGWSKFETLATKLNISPTDECSDKFTHERFSKAFKITFGLTLSNFYAEVENYINWNVKELG